METENVGALAYVVRVVTDYPGDPRGSKRVQLVATMHGPGGFHEGITWQGDPIEADPDAVEPFTVDAFGVLFGNLGLTTTDPDTLAAVAAEQRAAQRRDQAVTPEQNPGQAQNPPPGPLDTWPAPRGV